MDLGRLRVGHGFDLHRWSENDDEPLVLAGVEFPGVGRLVGHSDADVVAHACIDAILSGSGLGDIGSLFPDTDPALAGANSMTLLGEAVGRVTAQGWQICNVDLTVVTDRPKLASFRSVMEQNLTDIVGVPVAVKGKRTEGDPALQFGIRCFAVALLVAPELH